MSKRTQYKDMKYILTNDYVGSPLNQTSKPERCITQVMGVKGKVVERLRDELPGVGVNPPTSQPPSLSLSLSTCLCSGGI